MEQVSVCHGSPPDARILELPAPAAAAHLRHGDYVTGMVVSKQAGARGDGVHFARIGDALAAARETRVARQERRTGACRITISVGPGVFEGSVKPPATPSLEHFPLVVDVPDVTLRGAFRMQLDAGGRAIGKNDGADGTTLVATPGLLTTRVGGAQSFLGEPLIIVADTPDGFSGDGAVVEGFLFRSGNEAEGATAGGNAVWAIRVRGLVVRGNRIDGGFTEPIQLLASSAEVTENFLSGRGGSCALCLAGPGDFEVTGNRLMGPGGIPGILILPTSLMPVPPGVEQQVLPAKALVTAKVTNNEVRNHWQPSAGAGLRIAALGVLGSNVVSTSRVTASGNTFVGNTFGVYVEAAFPRANTKLRGDIELTLTDNTITASCQANLYVAFTRGSGLWSAPLRPYLRQSTYTLHLGGDLAWEDAWYAHLAGHDNTLVVDGDSIPNGFHVPFDRNRSCAP
ncbi:MAG: hypothetical protein KY466_00615 [Gemmatimonadetes bacterium]|nr:hypothetical protein [Gemmatimonadota bacterium]